MDLKALLVEAKQKVPPVLQVLQTGDETMLDIGGEQSSLVISVILLCFLDPSLWAVCRLLLTCLTDSQERGGARSVEVSAIVSQTAPSWRPCRPNKSPTSDGKTTWLTAPWTFKSFTNRTSSVVLTEVRNICEESGVTYNVRKLRKCFFIAQYFMKVTWLIILDLTFSSSKGSRYKYVFVKPKF